MFKHYLIVFFVSMVPLLELRGAIPYAVGFGLPLLPAYIVAIIGNMLPVPFIYFFARKVLEWGKDKPVIGKFFTFCLEKGEKGFQIQHSGCYAGRFAGRYHHGHCKCRTVRSTICSLRLTNSMSFRQKS